MKKALNIYIKAKHTQDECIGFIDGYEQACEDIQIKLNIMLSDLDVSKTIKIDQLLDVQESINQLLKD